MDCFNHSCPFRVNETSNANRCECIACPNRSNNDFIITSNRTLTNEELTMAEYVIKEALQAKLNRKKAGPANKRYTDGWNDAVLMVKSMIHSEKAADVAPVRHGRWELTGTDKRGRGGNWKCTGRDGCGKSYPYKCDYCPNCGAKMDLCDECEQDVES